MKSQTPPGLLVHHRRLPERLGQWLVLGDGRQALPSFWVAPGRWLTTETKQKPGVTFDRKAVSGKLALVAA